MDILNQLREANKIRVTAFGHTIEEWDLPRWGNAVAGETGELCNIIKKIDRGDKVYQEKGKEYPLDNKALGKEAADIVIYLDLLCQKAGFSLRDALVEKFNHTSDNVGSDIKLF
jgi:NTP pyrophosphatase (non-canonical NTP hydrolase)